VLVEEIAPEGYKIAENKTFTVNKKTANEIYMYDEPLEKYDISIVKEGESGALPGARLQLLDEDGNVVAEWLTSGDRCVIENVYKGTYKIHEIAAPDDYRISPDKEITVDAEHTEFVFKNYKNTRFNVKVYFVTYEGEGEEKIAVAVPGARLAFIEGDMVTQSWDTSNEPYVLENLPAGKYGVATSISPIGYLAANAKFFSLKEDDEETEISITMVCKPIQACIHLQDSDTKKEISGAVLQLYDVYDGEVVAEWTTSEEPKYFKAIGSGKYAIREKSATDEYKIVDDVIIDIDSVDGVQHFYMYNTLKQKPTPKPEPKPTSKSNDLGSKDANTTNTNTTTNKDATTSTTKTEVVQTGDNNNILPFAFGFVLLVSIGAVVLVCKKKK